jgi:hypothetical protein
MEKKQLYYEITDVSFILDGDSIDESIEHLNELKERFSKDYSDLTLEKNEDNELHLCGYKEETDEQLRKRLFDEYAKDKADYERLKAKFQ